MKCFWLTFLFLFYGALFAQSDTSAFLARLYVLSEDTSGAFTRLYSYNTQTDSLEVIDQVLRAPATGLINGRREIYAAVGDSLIGYEVPAEDRILSIDLGEGNILGLANTLPTFITAVKEADSNGSEVFLITPPSPDLPFAMYDTLLPTIIDLAASEFTTQQTRFPVLGIHSPSTSDSIQLGFYLMYGFLGGNIPSDNSLTTLGKLSNGILRGAGNSRLFNVLSSPDSLVELDFDELVAIPHLLNVDFHVSGPGQQVLQVQDTLYTSFDGGWGAIDVAADTVLWSNLIDTPYSQVHRDTATGNFWSVGTDSTGGFLREISSKGVLLRSIKLDGYPKLVTGIYNRRPRPFSNLIIHEWLSDVEVCTNSLGTDPDQDLFKHLIPSFPLPIYGTPYDCAGYKYPISGSETVELVLIDDFGDSAKTTLQILPQGLNISPPWARAVSVYPSPVSDILTIDYPPLIHISTVDLFSINGSLIQSVNTDQPLHAISFGSLTPGVYLIKLTDQQERSYILRIVKE